MPAILTKTAPPPSGHAPVLLARYTLDLTMSASFSARFDDALYRLGVEGTLARLSRAVCVELGRIAETTGMTATVRD